MTAARSDDLRETGKQIGAAVRRHWVLFLIEGIVLIVLGVLALLAPAIASVAATVFFGWLLLLSGILDVGLGALLLIGLPGTALWALGLLLGINLMFGGWALTFIALHARPTSAAAAA
jgi:uncharacterized membrane protein HdeD (DUF308 family)